MRVAFMGTPQFAVPSLEALLGSRHEVVVVVTGEDKPAGRSLRITETPVKLAAKQHGLPILQPVDLKDPFFARAFAGFNADVCLVVAFRILPPRIFSTPAMGSVNLHPSLLPQLRGAAPINRALMRGVTRTGVTTFKIERKVDTGNILLQESVDIHPEDDAGNLAVRLAEVGAMLSVRTLDELEEGTLEPRSQEGEVTTAPKITREMCLIDWNRKADEIHNLVRGLAPSPAAFSRLGDRILKVFKTVLLSENTSASPGVITIRDENRLFVSTGEGSLEVIELQLEGKRRMKAEDFLRGAKLSSGTELG